MGILYLAFKSDNGPNLSNPKIGIKHADKLGVIVITQSEQLATRTIQQIVNKTQIGSFEGGNINSFTGMNRSIDKSRKKFVPSNSRMKPRGRENLICRRRRVRRTGWGCYRGGTASNGRWSGGGGEAVGGPANAGGDGRHWGPGWWSCVV